MAMRRSGSSPSSWSKRHEPDGNPVAGPFQKGLYEQGIPATAFAVDDIHKEYERMKKLGVAFRGEPAKAGPAMVALLDDTCGNWIQQFQV